MMMVDRNISVGDRVFMWWSLVDEKKPTENEYRVVDKRDDYIRLKSESAGYELFFGKRDVEVFCGRIRKA